MTPDLATCPWSDWAPGTVSFCEARLCAVVREPANAWSAVAYGLGALWMLRRPGQPLPAILAQVLIGLGSFFFHASGTFAGELVDQTGMYLLSCLLLAYALGERLGLDTARILRLYLGAVVASVALNLWIRPIGIPLFGVELAVGLGLQLRLGGRPAPPRYRDLYIGLLVFAISLVAWVGDISRVVCDPDQHLFNGHALWHVLNAVSITWLGSFYAAGTGARGVRAP